MFRFATPAMIPALKQIWADCFGGGAEFLEYIFANLITPERVFVAADEGGEPAAMLCLQPFSFRSHGHSAEGEYIYGVATAPERQGRGYSTKLLQECHRVLGERGAALSVLVPAGESLFGFYGARGYEPFASVKRAAFPGEAGGKACGVSPANAGELAAVRDAFYGGRPFVRWDEAYLRYIAEECRFLGGDVLSFGGGRGYAVCYPSDERVVVKELVIPEELLQPAVRGILARFGKKECLVYLPEGTAVPCSNKVLPYAMVRWYDREKRQLMRGGSPYIAHVLDD